MTEAALDSIHLISASAGSGKTHRLVTELERAITRTENPVRPEGIIATTFTVKAAAELRERVRARLLETGHVEQAQRLGAARIGTVNAICGQLVTEFALELGVSPEMEVLDEVQAATAFASAISATVGVVRGEDGPAREASGSAAAALAALAERWHDLDWVRDVQKIADRARANALSPEILRASAGRSAEGLVSHLGPPARDGQSLERGLEKALATFLGSPVDATKTTAKAVAEARQAYSRLKAEQPLFWWTWAKLASAAVGKGSESLYEPVRMAASRHFNHPGLRTDISRCIELVIGLAADALEAYDRYKREWGLLDFVDQEVLALRLLNTPGVQEILRDQIDLVLVDEFQDTSPLQLDIFLALARLSPSNVWVGDQKQAIFGFRGTDPALMDAAIEALVEQAGEQARETLTHSYRSRAELVRLTSDIFAPAFERQGIPAARVRLEPAPGLAKQPDTLGPVIEGWRLGGKVLSEQSAALAAAVAALLRDPEARVRDVVTSVPQAVQPRDIAILCRSNKSCDRVTKALEAGGIPTIRARTGLIATPEAYIIIAALQLWIDPRQPLAAAQLGRFLVHPDDGDTWLSTVLESPGEAFLARPEVGRIAEAGRRRPDAGSLEAFDAVIEAVGLREICLRWGDAAQRLGNLDALRGMAHRYVAACQMRGEAATVSGLIAFLRSLADEEQDEQATLGRTNAVTVSTLHGAKGLEWPVTVLYEIDSSHEPSAFGVHLESDRERFNFSDPLGGRWIRYWPDPYAPQSKTELHGAVRGSIEHAKVASREERETLRLLYVGWTRARDLLVLAGKQGKIVGETLALLRDAAGHALIGEPELSCTWAGRPVKARIREAAPAALAPRTPEPGRGYTAAAPREHPPASVNISSIAQTGVIRKVEVIGTPLVVQPHTEWQALGSAVHAFFAADVPELEAAERLALAKALLARWDVEEAVQADALLSASNALRSWVEQRWGRAAWHREWPLNMRQESGTELIGYADTVIMSSDSFALVDHKCIGATYDEALESAAGYAGQVGTYAEIISSATGKRAAGCFTYLVAQGAVAEISRA